MNENLTVECLENTIKTEEIYKIIRFLYKREDLLNKLIDLTPYINDINPTIYQRMYHIKNNIHKHVPCKICNGSAQWNLKLNIYKNGCCYKCIIEYKRKNTTSEQTAERVRKTLETKSNYTSEQKAAIVEKTKKTNIKKYGHDSFAKTDKFKQDTLEKFGTTSPFGLKSVQEKSKETLIKNHGVDHNFKIPEVIENRKETWLENYGFDNPNKSDVIKQKIIATNNIKYNGNSPMCSSEIQEKSRNTLFKNYGVYYNFNEFSFTTFKFDKFLLNDKIIYLQGYEDYALYNILLKKYTEEDVISINEEITHYTGGFNYLYKGIYHKYFPDFYVKSINTIFEVKSFYTYTKDLEKNLLKRQSCIDKNINYEFIIINDKAYALWKKNNNYIIN